MTEVSRLGGVVRRAREWANNPTGRAFVFLVDYGVGRHVSMALTKDDIDHQETDHQLATLVGEVIDANDPRDMDSRAGRIVATRVYD